MVLNLKVCVDIKNSVVKNTRVSNTAILLRWIYGIFVALIDIFKATFVILIELYIINEYGNSGKEQTMLINITTVLFIF
ncbi:glycerol-3-phosphate acyltransferase [Virgibacillus proomii]|uniref:glycerol-3-phosphate acyltransferase n=1 Tax=Virgibacillus proomii TaxID=84407 RepID=UPI002481F6EB|nr:glycerol-3-phosphate acyltransferase [Virgibacillus proomii]